MNSNNSINKLQIPDRFQLILQNNPKLYSAVLDTLSDFGEILKENNLYFFEEYTDHGLEHVQRVLNASENIITESTLAKNLKADDICVLILAIILHDLGMHITFETFKNMIDGKYDSIKIDRFDEKSWSLLWEEYLDEAKRFSSKQLNKVFGDEQADIKKIKLTKKDELTGIDKKLIGEFLRRHHPRLAHEISIAGLLGKDNKIVLFANNLIDGYNDYRSLSGLIARSHGMEIRSTFEFLKQYSEEEWAFPYSIHAVFLMTVIRLADYFQFDSSRVSLQSLKLKSFSSPISELEHFKHLAIKFVKPSSIDDEALTIEAMPNNSLVYLKLKELFIDIQKELDISWAVLGEIYGKEDYDSKPNLKYRRIRSNLEKKSKFITEVEYVPEKITFTSDEELSKLLIAPLYGNNPIFGIRELLQNSIDACNEREVLNPDYSPYVDVILSKIEERYFFKISDNGKGMTLFEIQNYFLRAGSSFRKSYEWKKKFTNDSGISNVQRSGRFGIGALAAFLLGKEIQVVTKSIYEKNGYTFTAQLDAEQIEIKKINDFEAVQTY
jgi:molecular chaperone HtpG